jgi:5-methylcytosine-specific restriction protein A
VARRKTPGKPDYHTAAWQQKRERVLKRDHYLCQPCLQKSPVIYSAAYGVDHVIPVSEGGTDDEENLQSICSPCHLTKTQDESNRARSRR